MRGLSASELLNCWEQGLTQPLVRRALILLDAACPETAIDTLAELSIGQRDRCLLTLREWTFGPQLVCLTRCPECDERLEWRLNVADIRTDAENDAAAILSVKNAGYEIDFRLPNSWDIEAFTANEGLKRQRELLLRRCVLNIRCKDEDASIEQLPAEVLQAVSDRMAQADPQADVQLNIACSSCRHPWLATFDIVSFFWSEIDIWAQRTLHEVHVLASAYGWRETDILAMSAQRRQLYLGMVRG